MTIAKLIIIVMVSTSSGSTVEIKEIDTVNMESCHKALSSIKAESGDLTSSIYPGQKRVIKGFCVEAIR